jgi:hypothetical protein
MRVKQGLWGRTITPKSALRVEQIGYDSTFRKICNGTANAWTRTVYKDSDLMEIIWRVNSGSSPSEGMDENLLKTCPF